MTAARTEGRLGRARSAPFPPLRRGARRRRWRNAWASSIVMSVWRCGPADDQPLEVIEALDGAAVQAPLRLYLCVWPASPARSTVAASVSRSAGSRRRAEGRRDAPPAPAVSGAHPAHPRRRACRSRGIGDAHRGLRAVLARSAPVPRADVTHLVAAMAWRRQPVRTLPTAPRPGRPNQRRLSGGAWLGARSSLELPSGPVAWDEGPTGGGRRPGGRGRICLCGLSAER